jgi:Protein of unknown function (DUF3617)
MTMNRCTLLCVAFLIAMPVVGSAQSVKPGLWEVTSQVQLQGGQSTGGAAAANLQAELAKLPPEQRKMVEDMMAKNGVGIKPGGTGTALRVCISKEMAERSLLPTAQRGDCKAETSQRSVSGMAIKFTCTNPPSSGEGQVSFSGDSAYSMKMAVTTTVQGKPEKANISASGQWLAADCGAVKPLPIQ